MATQTLIPKRGIYPRMDPYDLPVEGDASYQRVAAVTAANCDLRDGRLQARKTNGASVGTGNTTIYLDGATWRNWATDVDVVRSPLDSATRIYYTGDGAPKVRDGATVYPLGIPVPSTGPTAATQAKSTFGYTPTWHHYYEEPDGTRVDVDTWVRSIRNATYRWTVSGSGTNEYYLELAAGGNPSIAAPTNVYENKVAMVSAALGALAVGEWGYGDNDALGFNTVYIRLTSGGPDPDTLAADTIGAALSAAVAETTPGTVYTQPWVPLRISATTSAQFILWGEIYQGTKYLGKVIPEPARDAPQTDAEYNGSSITGSLVTTTSSVLSLTYDTSRASQYTAERRYYIAYVRRWGDGQIDLGPPSALGAELSVQPTQDVNLTLIPTPPTGYGITHVWVYRLAVSISGEGYQYVTELTAGTATFLDTIADVGLGEVAPAYTNSPPPDGLFGLRAHPAGFLVGLYGKQVRFSALREVHAWPALTHYKPLKDTPVSLEVVGRTIIVTTTGDPVYIEGDDPAAMSDPDRVPIAQSCLSKRGTITNGVTVLYPAPDGMVMIGTGTAEIISDRFYTKEQWAALGPASMIAAWHDRQVFVFHAAGCLIFRFAGAGDVELTTITDTAVGVHVAPATDTLYLSTAGTILPFGTGATNRTTTFRSPYQRYPSTETWGAARLDADGYPMTLNIYRNGAATVTKSITSNAPFNLPKNTSAREFLGMEIVGAYGWDQLVLAQYRGDL